ncbi:16S rRNA pseudouridine(516) synthase [Aestuariicella sp. G3-2]|uniref:pseudouridine synthase n=1 Tax=Pseudomaricurvus albidus TaxID=2842452 RepID=UPI001C0B22C0|nr:16S rRNA pseudouridine(516) synthase [Aestuariicella albida]MBU3071207.1 16S rRNA pseudouridine(516) synthase [Aestuariicella albida]
MITFRTRLDRYLSQQLEIPRGNMRLILAQGRVMVNGEVAKSIHQVVDKFSRVEFDGRLLSADAPRYIMLNKPKGVVSATRDDHHTTVIDLLPGNNNDDLHLVGRLDFNTTGLVLLTNDGHWSRRLTQPETKVPKHYRVWLERPVTDDYIEAFANGIYFAYEGVTTRPASLKIISPFEVKVVLEEGRYHQIKRMFGHFNNKVVDLHREAIGDLTLDSSLPQGRSRSLTAAEVQRLTISVC